MFCIKKNHQQVELYTVYTIELCTYFSKKHKKRKFNTLESQTDFIRYIYMRVIITWAKGNQLNFSFLLCI